MTKIVVTGANGLVGYAIRQLNLPDIIYLSREDVDLTNFEETKRIFKYLKPKNIIHLAAQVGGIGSNLIHSGEYFRNNILINTNVLESARLAGVTKLVSFMSTCVFPEKSSYPLAVHNIHNGPPHPSNFGYAYAKRMLEVQSRAYRKEWNCNYVVLIPTNIYGPNDNFSLSDGHVVPALIHRAYLAKINGDPLYVWGSGNPLREFVYSSDIAKLAIWAIENYSDESPIILTSGIEISIRQLVEEVTKQMKFSGKITYNQDKPDGQYKKPSDASKLKVIFPDFHWTSLEVGLEKTIEWFLKSYPKIRM